MSRTINISSKLSSEKPKIIIGQDVYFVNDSVETIMKMDELAQLGTIGSLVTALECALGKAECKKLGVLKMPVKQIQVLFTAVNAAIMDLSYEDADSRFQGAEGTE